jgi:hypothetical protein
MDGYQGTAIRQPPAMAYICAGKTFLSSKKKKKKKKKKTNVKNNRLWRRESVKT